MCHFTSRFELHLSGPSSRKRLWICVVYPEVRTKRVWAMVSACQKIVQWEGRMSDTYWYVSIPPESDMKLRSAHSQKFEVTQGLYSLSGQTSYRQISWSLEAARLDVAMVVLLWNFTGTSVAALPRYLSNFRAIGKVQTRISRLRDFTRSCGKTSYRLVNRGSEGDPLMDWLCK